MSRHFDNLDAEGITCNVKFAIKGGLDEDLSGSAGKESPPLQARSPLGQPDNALGIGVDL